MLIKKETIVMDDIKVMLEVIAIINTLTFIMVMKVKSEIKEIKRKQ